jgi:hypothetical protein
MLGPSNSEEFPHFRKKTSRWESGSMASPSCTFVCCVESGSLEVGTVRMVESLRRWGGAFAASPVIAVTPRGGPGLARTTLDTFKKLQVRYLREHPPSPYAWFKFYNKPQALALAEGLADTDFIGWLDSDLVFVGEPQAFLLGEHEDFAACASDKEQGSAGPEDAFDPLWKANGAALGIELDSLPWVVTELEGVRIRLYWNGGVFVYRRSTRMGQHYRDACTKLMDARNRSSASGFSIGINEMSAIGFAVHQRGLKWRGLPYSHNFIMGSKTHAKWYREDQLRAARVVHYHDGMWPWFWDTFLNCLRATHPEVAQWLAQLGPMKNEASLFNRAWGKALRMARDRQERKYLGTCRFV